MDLLVVPGGTVRAVYAEAIDLAALGRPSITRASHVEPDADGPLARRPVARRRPGARPVRPSQRGPGGRAAPGSRPTGSSHPLNPSDCRSRRRPIASRLITDTDPATPRASLAPGAPVPGAAHASPRPEGASHDPGATRPPGRQDHRRAVSTIRPCSGSACCTADERADPEDLELVIGCPYCRGPSRTPGRAATAPSPWPSATDCDVYFGFDPPTPSSRTARPGQAAAERVAGRHMHPPLSRKASFPVERCSAATVPSHPGPITRGPLSHDHDHPPTGPAALRGVFRRSVLGISHRARSRRWSFTPRAGNCGRNIGTPHLAVEYVEPGDVPARSTRSPLPLEPWPTSKGRDDPVVLESRRARPDRRPLAGPGQSRIREYAVTPFGADRGVPRDARPVEPPSRATCSTRWPRRPPRAAPTTRTRYALDCIQLRGDTDEVVATDGRQLLVRSGIAFPWDRRRPDQGRRRSSAAGRCPATSPSGSPGPRPTSSSGSGPWTTSRDPPDVRFPGRRGGSSPPRRPLTSGSARPRGRPLPGLRPRTPAGAERSTARPRST